MFLTNLMYNYSIGSFSSGRKWSNLYNLQYKKGEDKMNVIGQVVEHKSLGMGKICDHKIRKRESYIVVDFSGDHKEFQFPDIFKSIITAKDEDFKAYVADLVEKKKEIDRREEILRQKEIEKEHKNIIREEPVRRKLKEKKTKKEGKKESSIKEKNKNNKSDKGHNIAFKCNYCDGGKSSAQVGFSGLCSNKNIVKNIEGGRGEWCKFQDCACRHYYDKMIDRAELEEIYEDEGVCYESELLKNWRACAGTSFDEDGETTAKRIVSAKVNHLAILTTVNPEMVENKRYIFAVFLIDEAFAGDPDNNEEGYVLSAPKSRYRIKLSEKEAKKMLFWNYYYNSGKKENPRWGTGLFRYMTDEMAAQILRDIAEIKKGTDDEKAADNLFKYFCSVNNIDIEDIGPKKGALKRS